MIQIAAAAAILVVFCAAAGGRESRSRQAEYRHLLSLSPAVAAETREQACLEAIALYPGDPEAYLNLLNASQEDGIFSEEESQRFLHVYDSHKDQLARDREGAVRLCRLAGEMYFFLYGGDGAAFRTRLMKALPFYENVAMLAPASDPAALPAHHMCVMGRFYRDYRSGMGEAREIRSDEYEELLTSFTFCLSGLKETDAEDSWRKLRLIQEMIRFVGEDRKNMLAAGVSEEDLRAFLKKAGDVLREIPANRDRSSVLAEELREELKHVEDEAV